MSIEKEFNSSENKNEILKRQNFTSNTNLNIVELNKNIFSY